MGPAAAFVIAVLGCGDGQTSCQTVNTLPTKYDSQASCLAATQDVLANSTDLDFPTIVAECRRTGAPLPLKAERKTDQLRPLVIASR